MRSEIPRASGLAAEMSGADFSDARLSARLCKVVEAVMTAPDQSFPSLFDDSGLEAAYRFFNNDGGHARENSRSARCGDSSPNGRAGRVAGGPRHFDHVLRSQRRASGAWTDSERRGQAFFAHVSLALSGDGRRTPLGVLGLSHHIRRGALRRKKVKAKNNIDSERARWGRQIETVTSLGLDRTRVVHVMDREADDYALFAQLVGAGDRFVIRLAHDRRLEADETDEVQTLAQAVGQVPCERCARSTALAAPAAGRSPKQRRIHPAREGRMAKLAFGAASVVLRRPSTQPKTLPATLSLNIARVWELEPPAGESPVEWILITTEPLETDEQILRVVDWYRARWGHRRVLQGHQDGLRLRHAAVGNARRPAQRARDLLACRVANAPDANTSQG
jgi:hypothetical protein